MASGVGARRFRSAGLFAEFERAMIRHRIGAGLSRARAEGKRLGRPKVPSAIERRAQRHLAKGMGILKVANSGSGPARSSVSSGRWLRRVICTAPTQADQPAAGFRCCRGLGSARPKCVASMPKALFGRRMIQHQYGGVARVTASEGSFGQQVESLRRALRRASVAKTKSQHYQVLPRFRGEQNRLDHQGDACHPR